MKPILYCRPQNIDDATNMGPLQGKQEAPSGETELEGRGKDNVIMSTRCWTWSYRVWWCLAFWPDLSLLSSCYCLLEWQCLLCIIICWKYVNPLLQCYYYYCCCFVLQSLVVKILPSSFEETLDFWTMLKMWRLCEPLKSDRMCFTLWDGPEPRKARDECYSLSANACHRLMCSNLGHTLVVLFWENVEPLRGRASLEEMDLQDEGLGVSQHRPASFSIPDNVWGP